VRLLHVGVTCARLPPAKVSRRSLSRHVVTRIALAGAAAAIVARVVAACVIWDPPTDDPAPIHYHPLIETASVVPPSSVVLNELPATFTVPLEIVDPTASFVYEVFVDFDPLNTFRAVPVLPTQNIDPTMDPPDGGIIAVQFSLASLDRTHFDPTTCHVIQFVVALGLSKTSFHTPDSNGADEIEWQYAPAGANGGCVTFDAGDGAFPDGDAAIVVTPGD
jgi:hypothetical protein